MTTRPVSCRIPSYRAVFLIRTVLLLGALLLGGATDALAQTGTISGTITGSDTLQGLPNTDVWIFNLNSNGDTADAIVTTNASGFYTASVPAGTYAVYTQNRLGYINEAYNNRPCSAVCELETVDQIVVTNGGSSTADFVLDPGGRVAGRITDAVTGLGIAGVMVMFIPENAEFFWSTAITDANGDYVSNGGTVTGIVYAFTFNTLGYQNEVWDNVKCGGEECDVTEFGTPINVTLGVTTGGIDLALDRGGVITGTVRDANLVPLVNVSIRVYDTNGDRVEDASTDASGHYTTGGLVSGTYYVGTENSVGLVDKIWVGIPCPNGGFCDPTNGAPVAVTLGEETPGIDFVLQPGGRILGTVTNAATGLPIGSDIFVGLNDASGQFIGGANSSDGDGTYTIRGLPPGTYYASIFGPLGFFNQVYNGLTCSTNCNVQAGTPIHVTAGVDTININFALQPTTAVGSISGTVRDVSAGPPGVAINSLNVQLLTATGAQIANVNTNPSGVYTFSNLPVASYYVRANPGNQFIGMLHGSPTDVVCLNCNVLTTSGAALVPVASGATTTVDFNLTAGGRIGGTVTNAVGGAALIGIQVQVFSDAGVNLGQTSTTSPSGNFTTRGLPNGTYYLRTNDPTGAFVGELYDNVFCPGPACTVVNGTPVAVAGPGTVGGRNFQLAAGGRISGAVTGPAGMNIQFQTNVTIFTDTGTSLGNTALIDAAGNYNSFALPSGRFYIRTTNSAGLVDEIYDNIPCVSPCSPTVGTPIDVSAGAIASGKNFSLIRGGNIGGTVRDAGTNALLGGVRVFAYRADGTAIKGSFTNANGEYSIIGIPPDTYYLKTSVGSTGLFYLDELFNELPCPVTCTLTNGTPVVVIAGVTEGGKNFTLTPGGGAVTGIVRDTAGNALGGVVVQIMLADGTVVKQVASSGTGAFAATLAAGTYYARTVISDAAPYLDELHDELPCTPTCNVAAGAPLNVVNSGTISGVDFTLAPNLVKNGRFESGLSSWVHFATPDDSFMSRNVTSGVLQFSRTSQPAGPVNQVTQFQDTGIPVASGTALTATFDLGNSSSTPKYMKVLMVNGPGFEDFAACVFWLPGDATLRSYRMKTHTNQAWANPSIYFYASNVQAVGTGQYLVDNVTMAVTPGESLERTDCIDPLAPLPPGGPASGNLVTNGDFATGLAPWAEVGTITVRNPIVGQVLEFLRLGPHPPGNVLQNTGQPVAANQILTATFDLGNSSTVRKRFLILIGNEFFTDFAACTWTLPANTPMTRFGMKLYAMTPWPAAWIYVYPRTNGTDEWSRLDNVTLRRTPAATNVGSMCLEGTEAIALGSPPPPGATASTAGAGSGLVRTSDVTGGAWFASGTEVGARELRRSIPLDLTGASSATLALQVWLATPASWGEVQVRGRDGEWKTVQVFSASDEWATIAVDLVDYLGQMVDVRVVFYGGG